MPPTMICRVCHAVIEDHWQLFDHATCQRPVAEPEATPWAVEKSRNRLQRRVERIAAGRYLPRLAHRLNGAATRALREAVEVLRETESTLDEVKR